jgi:hypothetical protein
MKKIILIFTSLLFFYSCSDSNNDFPNLAFELLPIDEFTAPESFILGEKDTLKLKYSLRSNCSYFDNIYYEYQDTTRIVAIRSIKDLDANCDLEIIQYDYNLIVNATQEEDYLFKFYKGKDTNGENIFEEVVVPVN